MDYQKVSKELSYALRHAPQEYGLELDEQGWVAVEHVLGALRKQPKWRTLTEADLHTMIARSEKKRHEIRDGKIRALYGHSAPQKITKEAKQPPEFLYHGTPRHFVPSILKSGLLPKGRQYVHLSDEIGTAQQVGERRDEQPVILRIDAWKAWRDGVLFYHGNEMVWLADRVEPQYIAILDDCQP
ncbi:RNA 2'-phosphotransferase [Brevibacillus fluminis]|uniref:RNA 2'-phosphotransferase n=1 Tax=Brevibacillus fluminis TaxID=511487 RepID=UPI003F8C34A3